MNRLFLGLFLLMLIQSSLAKTYKWVDAEGNVHFSQTPPVEAQKSRQLNEINIDAGRYKPRMKNGRLYCGNAHISVSNTDQVRYLVSVKMQLQTAKENLAYHRKSDFSYGGKNDRIEEYKCLVGWAEGELDKHKTVMDELRAEYHALLKQNQNASAYQQRNCPEQGGWLMGEEAQQWYDCYKKASKVKGEYRKQMKLLRSLFADESS